MKQQTNQVTTEQQASKKVDNHAIGEKAMSLDEIKNIEYKDQTVMVAGGSLSTIFESEELCEKMNKLFNLCQCVVIYRSSPNEKARVIQFVIDHDPEAFCCSIGDGANDINMIQTSHIGIGIEGNEGNQAAYFADYSIPEFQGLRRLILWHGRNCG